MELQPTFVSNIHATYKEAGKVWLNQLPTHLKDLEKLWDFHFIQQIPNLTFSFVCVVALNSNNERVILKTAPEGGRTVSEIQWLHCFKQGVPKLYAQDEKKHAFLMEYLKPGHSLKTLVQAGQDETATRIICQLILELQADQKRMHEFQHLSELVKDLAHLKGHIDAHTLSKAKSLFHDLTTDRTKDVVLHGDLHHDNIIHQDSAWKVIDPHGYIGDPVAEVGAMIRNPFDCFPDHRPLATIVETRLKILAEVLPFDPQRIKAWTFCITILSAAWNIQDFGPAAKVEFEIASAIDRAKL